MKFRHLLLLLFTITVFTNLSCEEEFVDPEATEDDIFYSDPNVDTDIIFTFRGTRYFTEDFVDPTMGVLYSNTEWRFLTGAARIYKEVNGTRELAGVVQVSAINYINYEGGEKNTFRGTYSTGDENIYVTLRVGLFEDDGFNNILGMPVPTYSTNGAGNLVNTGIEFIEGPWNNYISYEASLSFDKISDRRIKAVFEGELADVNNVSSGGRMEGEIDYRVDNDPLVSDGRYVPAAGEEETGGFACTNLDYNGPQAGQAKQWCQYAQFLGCQGLQTEKQVQCNVLKDFGATCPYCN